MMNRVELKEEMMVQVNGGAIAYAKDRLGNVRYYVCDENNDNKPIRREFTLEKAIQTAHKLNLSDEEIGYLKTERNPISKIVKNLV